MMSINKPVVHYIPNKYQMICTGTSAYVWPIDHPSDLVSNTKPITTSKVIKYDRASGEFETMNTLYKPVDSID